MAVVLVSSELPELIGLSDRIVMLVEGRIGGTFSARRSDRGALLAAALAGRAAQPTEAASRTEPRAP